MPSEAPRAHHHPVRFQVELTRGEGGRVSGEVSTADRPATPFSGWLELLRLLEDHVDRDHQGEELSG